MSKEINILALAKGDERYLFLFSDSQRAEALRMLGRHASNPELSFSWYDAAVLGQQIRSTGASPAPQSAASCPLPMNAGQPRFQLPPFQICLQAGCRNSWPRPVSTRPPGQCLQIPVAAHLE